MRYYVNKKLVHLHYFFTRANSAVMTHEEARNLLDQLGISQVELGRRMSELTGRDYSAQTINAWFRKDRGPSDACAIFLRLAVQLEAAR